MINPFEPTKAKAPDFFHSTTLRIAAFAVAFFLISGLFTVFLIKWRQVPMASQVPPAVATMSVESATGAASAPVSAMKQAPAEESHNVSNSSDSSSPEGTWLGIVNAGNRAFPFSIKLRVAGDRVTGTAVFPIGEGQLTGSVVGTSIKFKVQHRLASTNLDTNFIAKMISPTEMEIQMNDGGAPTMLKATREVGAFTFDGKR